jgi:hypothetical protein
MEIVEIGRNMLRFYNVLIYVSKIFPPPSPRRQEFCFLLYAYVEGGKGGGVWVTFHNENKAFSRFTCLKKAISRKTRF